MGVLIMYTIGWEEYNELLERILVDEKIKEESKQ